MNALETLSLSEIGVIGSFIIIEHAILFYFIYRFIKLWLESKKINNKK